MKHFVTAALLFCPLTTLAADSDYPWWGFIGFDGGLSTLSSSNTKLESNKSGTQFNFKLLASRYWEKWVIDLGGGYFHNRVTGDNLLSATPTSSEARVTTDAFFAELSPRYRLGKNWQFGPVINLLLGKDVGFSESDRFHDEKSNALLGGLRIEYEWQKLFGGRFRAGAQGLTDITISGRQVYWAQIDLQWGIPLGSHASNSEPIPAPALAPTPIAQTTPAKNAPIIQAVGADRIKIQLPETVLHFDTARAKLDSASKALLNRIVATLMENATAWKLLKVEGHSDQRGRAKINLKLSQQRAEAVQAQMTEAGVPEKRIQAKGWGSTRPLRSESNARAWAINRRVEIWLDGVQNPDELVRKLQN